MCIRDRPQAVPSTPRTASSTSHSAGDDDALSQDLVPIDIDGLAQSDLHEWLKTMMLIREFEVVSTRQSLAGKVPGGMHSSAGQEAVAVGPIRALGPDDILTSSHRSHHHALAKGLTPRSVMAELYGKATGCLGGRGGHMHLADFSLNLYGSNGIVGGGLGLAMGIALGAHLRKSGQVALGFFGDGGANTGRVWEFVNMAALWKLPLVIICENNLYAVETHTSRATAGGSIAHRASGFGLPAMEVDGQDVAAMFRVTSAARERALSGDGPTFIEARTYRYEGHNAGEVPTYRTAEEVEYWRSHKDPIERLRTALQARESLSAESYQSMQNEVAETVADSVEFAERSPWPDPQTAAHNVLGLQVTTKGNP